MLLRFAALAALLALASAPAHAQTSETWQQEVAYEMDITLLADRHQMRGTQRLVYTNNSPDTLRTAYYHLYFNAFNPQSAMAERNRQLPDPDGRVVPRIFNLGPEEVGYHRVLSLTQDGRPVDYVVTGTVLRVDLAEPILPGASTTFEMAFRSQVPLQTRRSGRDNREGIDYSMSQWYPKMAAYDLRGWHPDPYIGREFYAPFGTFDVEITAPAAYTLGATGVLQNPEEVGHGYDRAGTWRPEDYTASADSLTWHFTAEQVHDFAWAADPDYIHEHFEAEGTAYHILYQPGVEAGWEPMDQWVPELIEFFGEQYGPYAYPQFTVAQAGDGGMEYPMINFLTGRRSPLSLLGVTAHEIAHEWFYAILASNEADYAWMDEGFASYATEEGVAHVLGRPANHTGAYLSVLNLQHVGLYERLNTPADWFTTNAAYSPAYSGGEMIVDMLGYVISDSLRNVWLEEYYERYQFRHPSPYDLERIAEDVSSLRLDWYFEQFLNTTRAMDYALTDLDVEEAASGYRATVTLERKGEIVMPADVRLTLEDGTEHWVTVPLGIMQGHKPVPAGWSVAEPWQWPFPEYTFTVALPARPVRAELDPLSKTPDTNRLNNASRFPLEARFLQPPGQSWDSYRLGWRPLAQYAYDFGFGAGLQARGQYLFGRHRLQAMLKLWPQVIASNGEAPEREGLDEPQDAPDEAPPILLDDGPGLSWFDGIDYALTYATNVRALGPLATFEVSAEKHLGFLENTISLAKPLAPVLAEYDARLSLSLVHQLNPTDRVFGRFEDTYTVFRPCAPPSPPCIDPRPITINVNPFQREHVLSARAQYAVADDAGYLRLTAEAGGSLRSRSVTFRPFYPFDPAPPTLPELEDIELPLPRQSATRLLLEAGKSADVGPFEGLTAFAFGMGAENLALHKRFRLGAGTFEQRWRDDAFRTAAAAFKAPLQDAHVAAFSGTGPVAYLLAAAEEGFRAGDAIGGTPIGRILLAGSLSLTAQPFDESTWLRPLRLSAFSGIGTAWSEGTFLAGFDAGDLLADAGFGLRYDVAQISALGRWMAQSDVLQGLQVTAKFPLWASVPGRIDAGQDALAFRWLLGLRVGLN